MGSVGPTDVSAIEENEIVVLVTGFGPFRAQYPVNPAWEIARALPPLLSTSAADVVSPTIRILLHPEPVRVNYDTVRALVPKLWASAPRIDFCVHVGMASGREYYSVERRGHRDGYAMKDVDGNFLMDEKRRKDALDKGEEWVWERCPKEILTDFDIDDVWMRWRAALPDLDIRRSEDAGRYLCDFIYYSSLAHLWKMGEERKVVFLHVPVDSDAAAVETGTDVLVELIRALAQSKRMKKITDGGN